MAYEGSYIKISNITAINNKLSAELEYSEDISKFFYSKLFNVEYNEQIGDINESILTIPPLAAVITVAWATGADIYLESIDKTFFESLNKIKSIFMNWFPKFSFSTEYHIANYQTNKLNNEGYGILYSGGLDSLSSYIKYKEEKPSLISIWGADVPLDKTSFWDKVECAVNKLAEMDAVNSYFIKTNVREIMNENLLNEIYLDEEDMNWWMSVSHGLILTSLTVTLPIKNLIMASSLEGEILFPDGSDMFKLFDYSWADNKLIYDYGLTRHEKIKYLLKGNTQYYQFLRVCYAQFQDYNCGMCEKCLRTITGLLLEGIDPNKSNFKVKEGFLDLIKFYLENNLLLLQDEVLYWEDIQNNVPEKSDIEFFNWYKTFDFSDYNYQKNIKKQIALVYYYRKYRGFKYTVKLLKQRII
jgi:hypothetical protein